MHSNRRFIPPANGPRMTKEAQQEMKKFNAGDVQRAKAFKELMRMEGFSHFQGLLNSYIEMRVNDLLKPTAFGQELEGEHVKGTVYGLIMARDAIPAIVADYEQFAKTAGIDEEEEDDQHQSKKKDIPPAAQTPAERVN